MDMQLKLLIKELLASKKRNASPFEFPPLINVKLASFETLPLREKSISDAK